MRPPVPLPEPVLNPEELRTYAQGWQLFAARRFWHAHEAWEGLWQRHSEPARSFFQGLIQLAAAYFLLLGELDGPFPGRPARPLPQRFRGALRNFEKAAQRLAPFPADYLRADVPALHLAIDRACRTLRELGPDRLAEFPIDLVAGAPLLQASADAED